MVPPAPQPASARSSLGVLVLTRSVLMGIVLAGIVWTVAPSPAEARRRRPKRLKPPAGMVAVPPTILRVPVVGGAPSDAPTTPDPQPPAKTLRIEHKVAPLFMDAREVTVADYRRCVFAGRCTEPLSGTYFSIAGRRKDWADFCNWGKPDRQDHPINCVTQLQAKTYCDWAGKALPTEEQWLAAAGAGKERPYPWGDKLEGVDLCWNRREGRLGTCAAGTHPQDRSPYGVLDMGGNVSEWTSSALCPFDKPGCKSSLVVTRGGNWYNPYSVQRGLARRLERAPDGADHTVGFRCAKLLKAGSKRP